MSSYVHNAAALSGGELRDTALALIEAAISSIATERVLAEEVHLNGTMLTCAGRTYDLSAYRRLLIVTIGKAGFESARLLEQILGERISDGVAIDVGEVPPLARIRPFKGTHPYPSEANVHATGALLDMVCGASEHDFVLTVISGGGSTLLCQPYTHTIEDEVALVKRLFSAGATIQELNTVRKHLSAARGGNLAVAAHPAEHCVLVMSDVPGNDLSFIASGPTVRDDTTLSDARTLLERYQVTDTFPVHHLRETPKDATLFRTTSNQLILTNATALTAMQREAQARGYVAHIPTTQLSGEARVVASRLLREVRACPKGTVLLYGGETTVTITGTGAGGRNEELALAALLEIADDELVVSLASDGRDNTDLAGGIADVHTKTLASAANLDPATFLANNDSYTFFHTLQQGIHMGYTGSNIADLAIVIRAKPA